MIIEYSDFIQMPGISENSDGPHQIANDLILTLIGMRQGTLLPL